MICNRAGVQIFLGTLREAEVERINDRISQAVMETCLAMTIFREEFNVEFVAMFTILTFVKVFHWLVQDRVDYIETVPTVSRLHHLRILTFMALLLVCPPPGCQPVTPVPPAHVHLAPFSLQSLRLHFSLSAAQKIMYWATSLWHACALSVHSQVSAALLTCAPLMTPLATKTACRFPCVCRLGKPTWGFLWVHAAGGG